jgi:hypothetical protein
LPDRKVGCSTMAYDNEPRQRGEQYLRLSYGGPKARLIRDKRRSLAT